MRAVQKVESILRMRDAFGGESAREQIWPLRATALRAAVLEEARDDASASNRPRYFPFAYLILIRHLTASPRISIRDNSVRHLRLITALRMF